MTCMRLDFDRQYFDDHNVCVIYGNAPTLSVIGKPEMYGKQEKYSLLSKDEYKRGF